MEKVWMSKKGEGLIRVSLRGSGEGWATAGKKISHKA